MKVFIHIGLPKTATTFFQTKVFGNLDQREIWYNPENIMKYIFKTVGEIHSEVELKDIKKNISNEFDKISPAKILISHEGLTEIEYRMDYKKQLYFLKKVFPEAQIILFLRFQPDLISSLYKEAVHQGHCKGSIKEFFNGENMEAIQRDLVIDPYDYDYKNIIKDLTEAFSKENVHIFFYENFNRNRAGTINEICKLLDVTNRPVKTTVYRRSLSSFSLNILINLNKVCEKIGFSVPCNIQYKTKWLKLARIPLREGIRNRKLNELLLFLISKGFTRVRWYCTWVCWRSFMQNKLDKIIYLDEDQLTKYSMRNKLSRYYQEKNLNLMKSYPMIYLPRRYIGKE
jgi:hypothetical protein